jgi:hypothetical protein
LPAAGQGWRDDQRWEELQRALEPSSDKSPEEAQDGVEACFFALRAIATWVPDTEAVVLPAAFRLLPTLDATWRPAIRAGIAAICAYASWLHNHTADLLEPVVGLLVSQLETAASRARARDEASRAASSMGSSRATRENHRRLPSGPSPAAKALKAVCSSCRRELARLRALDLRDRLVDAQRGPFLASAAAAAATLHRE